MRRTAEIAHSTTDGALHALHAARDAAREVLQHAAQLTVAPEEVRAVREVADRHLRHLEEALGQAEHALRASIELDQAVDRIESTRFGLPVLRPAAGA